MGTQLPMHFLLGHIHSISQDIVFLFFILILSDFVTRLSSNVSTGCLVPSDLYGFKETHKRHCVSYIHTVGNHFYSNFVCRKPGLRTARHPRHTAAIYLLHLDSIVRFGLGEAKVDDFVESGHLWPVGG